MSFVIAKSKQEVIDMISRVIESSGGGVKQSDFDTLKNQVTTFLGTDSETLAQVMALIKAAEESPEIATLTTNLQTLQTTVEALPTQSALDAVIATVNGKASQSDLSALSTTVGQQAAAITTLQGAVGDVIDVSTIGV